MRKYLLMAAAICALSTSSFARERDTGPGDEPGPGDNRAAHFETSVGKALHADALKGLDVVVIVSSMSVPITAVTCEDKWTLVGEDVYKSVRGNPHEIAPMSITPIRTNDFGSYCPHGLIGHYGLGKTVVGKVAGNSNFKETTVVLFSGDQ